MQIFPPVPEGHGCRIVVIYDFMDTECARETEVEQVSRVRSKVSKRWGKASNQEMMAVEHKGVNLPPPSPKGSNFEAEGASPAEGYTSNSGAGRRYRGNGTGKSDKRLALLQV